MHLTCHTEYCITSFFLCDQQVDISAEEPKAMMMHWAINDWNLSPESCRPEGTQQIDDKAVQTPFKNGKSIHLTFPEADCPSRYATVHTGMHV